MTTFKQFLQEQEMGDLAHLLETNCAPFLEESKRQGFLYRGIKGLAKMEAHLVTTSDGEELEFTVKTVRDDRKPLDTRRARHEILDDEFKKRFGWRPRSEGVFAYGEGASIQDVKAYGEPCIIFPAGPIKYVWSKYVEDLYADMPSTVSDDQLDGWIDESMYQADQLDLLVQRGNEVMINCRKYYAFPIAYKPQLRKALGL